MYTQKKQAPGKAGVHNTWPVKAFLTARENFLKCRKCCKSATSNK